MPSLEKWLSSHFDVGPTHLAGRDILEIGCGRGGFCVFAALNGADRVVGIDLNQKLIDSCQKNVGTHYPQLQDKIEFYPHALSHLEHEKFVFVFSKNVFEHVDDLPDLLQQIKCRLKQNGRVYASFGPLWTSPFGDHRRFHRKLAKTSGYSCPQFIFPWSHLIISKSRFVRIINYLSQNDTIDSTYSGINKLSYSEYLSILKNSGFSITELGINKTQTLSAPHN